ncbi:hypothetical protein LTR78_007895 [Recurvomyces mirabilis]|uniref:Uncharacterized protein n=1 Tax=Recurvomyces mirabilis TaxID=574656 RepID=A0AAE0TRF9_9PEZI|nr:hypothetical protein LTR78_007895 [Recurvomyces mirabilis]KAK5152430.1 hypothetical protein LTS14_008377 [Recurvomyces mirabilis]
MTGFSAPYVWRTNGGYQSHPPLPAPGMLFVPAPPPFMQAPVQYYPGPVGIHSVAHRRSTPPPPPPPAPAKKAEAKPAPKPASEPAPKPEKKEEPKPKAKISRAPPPLKDGVNYMFALEHTTIHIFQKPAPIWMEKYSHAQL